MEVIKQRKSNNKKRFLGAFESKENIKNEVIGTIMG